METCGMEDLIPVSYELKIFLVKGDIHTRNKINNKWFADEWSKARVIVFWSCGGWMPAAIQWTPSAFSLTKLSINRVQASFRNSWKQGPKVVKGFPYHWSQGQEKDVPVTFLHTENTTSDPDWLLS